MQYVSITYLIPRMIQQQTLSKSVIRKKESLKFLTGVCAQTRNRTLFIIIISCAIRRLGTHKPGTLPEFNVYFRYELRVHILTVGKRLEIPTSYSEHRT